MEFMSLFYLFALTMAFIFVILIAALYAVVTALKERDEMNREIKDNPYSNYPASTDDYDDWTGLN